MRMGWEHFGTSRVNSSAMSGVMKRRRERRYFIIKFYFSSLTMGVQT